MYLADFDNAYSKKMANFDVPECKPPTCFVGSYAPVTRPGQEGPFHVNSGSLQPNRLAEINGPVTLKSKDFKGMIIKK